MRTRSSYYNESESESPSFETLVEGGRKEVRIVIVNSSGLLRNIGDGNGNNSNVVESRLLA